MSNFPTSLDDGTTLPNPSATNNTNNPSHAGIHDNENTSIIALETKLGISSSTPTNNNLLVGTGTGTSAWTKASPSGVILGTTDTQSVSNKAFTSSTWTGGTISNPTLTVDSIAGFAVSNTGSVYGISVALGVLTTANSIGTGTIVQNGVGSSQLATTAITLGYVPITSNITTTSTTQTQATGLTSTVTIPAGGRKVEIMFFGNVQVGTNIKKVAITIWDGTVGSGTQLGMSTTVIQNSGNDQYITCYAVVTPSAGSKTYNVGWSSDSGGGVTATMSASATQPAFILVKVI